MMLKKTLVAAAISMVCALAAAQGAPQNYPLPTPDQQKIVDKDASRFFGDAPADGGPLATDLSPALRHADIDKILRKVADWQLARTQAHLDQIWTSTTLFTGFMAASEATGDPKYRNAMLDMARKFEWKGRRKLHPDADDLAIGQTYLELYFQEPSADKIEDTRKHLESLIDLKTMRPGDDRLPWWWCDSLFMAPPVWLKMYKATGDRRYLDYVHQQWQKSYDALWDKEEKLYARDASYIGKKEPNGKKIFWSRGEGWVMGGLARSIDLIPADDPKRPFYIKQLQEMSASLAKLQDKDGNWHAGLLDPQTYPLAETSGAAYILYGMAYGVNRGYLDEKTYRPVIERGWAGLIKHIYADGRLGGIQQTGAEPAFYRPASSYNYGVGGFLLAASELKKLTATKELK